MKIIIANNQKTYFEAMSIRGRVFVDEQHVPSAIEIDDLDKKCLHVLLYDEANEPKAVLRLIEKEHYYKVGRVAVLKEDRSKGYGKAIMLGIEKLEPVKNKGQLQLDAQLSAVGFYEALGYQLEGEPFLEANIWHRHAIKNL